MARNGDDTTRMVRLAAGGLGQFVGLVNCFMRLNRRTVRTKTLMPAATVKFSPAPMPLAKLACQTGSKRAPSALPTSPALFFRCNITVRAAYFALQ